MTHKEMYVEFLTAAQIKFNDQRQLFSENTTVEVLDQMDNRTICAVFLPDGTLEEFGTFAPPNR